MVAITVPPGLSVLICTWNVSAASTAPSTADVTVNDPDVPLLTANDPKVAVKSALVVVPLSIVQ